MENNGVVEKAIEDLVMSPAKRTVYYRFAHVVIQLLEKHQVEYFAHSGTLLGIARHEGFIPWDDDIDVMVPVSQEDKLASFLEDIDNYGLKLGTSKTIESGLVQLVPNSNIIFDNGYPHFLGFDIFLGTIEEIQGEPCFFYKHKDFRRWFKNNWMPYKDVYPLQAYKFGPLTFMGPKVFDTYFKNSGFDLNEAVIKVHKASKDKAENVIDFLKSIDEYPIKDSDVLRMEAPYKEFVLHDLEYYRVM